MNVALLAAALVAINPGFVGSWCSPEGELVATFTKDEYVQVFSGENEGCSLSAARAAKPADLFTSQEPMIYSAGATFQAEYLLCGNEDPSLSHIGVKYTLQGDTLTEWNVTKIGGSSPNRKLARCDFEEDY